MATAATEMTDKRWYIVHAYSNFEKKVAESIREQSKQRGLEELFELVLVPTEKVTEVRRGRKIDAERKFFPGYVLVKMKLTDEAECRLGRHGRSLGDSRQRRHRRWHLQVHRRGPHLGARGPH